MKMVTVGVFIPPIRVSLLYWDGTDVLEQTEQANDNSAHAAKCTQPQILMKNGIDFKLPLAFFSPNQPNLFFAPTSFHSSLFDTLSTLLPHSYPYTR